MTVDPSFLATLSERVRRHPNRPAICFLDDQGQERSWTYAQLWNRAVTVAGQLRSRPEVDGARQQPRAILLFPAGLDFFAAFFGAQLAGWIPVPTSYPKPHRAMPRLDACVRNCQAALILCDSHTLATLDRSKLHDAATVPALAVDSLSAAQSDIAQSDIAQSDNEQLPLAAIGATDIAFLQYTSGSTSEPKGVIVSHANLLANLEAIRDSFAAERLLGQRSLGERMQPGTGAGGRAGKTRQTGRTGTTDQAGKIGQIADEATDDVATAVFWLPHFHDMGLIGGVLTPLYLGMRTVLISPQTFVRRPRRWLQAIEDYRAVVSGAPSFAFEWCADRLSPDEAAELDLSSLRLMFCGAEPIRSAALRAFEARFAASGFDPASYYPCYGLAESTLLAAGGRGPSRPTVLEVDSDGLRQGEIRVRSSVNQRNVTSLVSCGYAALGSELAIVDPSSGVALGEDRVGEIWLRGPSVAAGYWNADSQQQARFQATLARKRGGLLAWFGGGPIVDQPNAYYRTGDLGFLHGGELYIAGRIKDLIIVRGRNYAPQDIEATIVTACHGQLHRVAAVPVAGPRGEALGVAAEVDRSLAAARFPALLRSIRQAVIDEHGIDPREILLVRNGGLPVTTSGKIQRSACRDLFTPTGSTPLLQRWCRSSGQEGLPVPLPTLPIAPTADDFPAVRDSISQWIGQWLVIRGGIAAEQIEGDQRFESLGLDSMLAIELLGELEDVCNVPLTPALVMEQPTITGMAELAARFYCGLDGEDAEQPELMSATS